MGVFPRALVKNSRVEVTVLLKKAPMLPGLLFQSFIAKSYALLYTLCLEPVAGLCRRGITPMARIVIHPQILIKGKPGKRGIKCEKSRNLRRPNLVRNLLRLFAGFWPIPVVKNWPRPLKAQPRTHVNRTRLSRLEDGIIRRRHVAHTVDGDVLLVGKVTGFCVHLPTLAGKAGAQAQ